MKCPACETELVRRTVSGVELDVCENGCGGIWFDGGELQKLDASSEGDGEELLGVLRQHVAVSVDHDADWTCPHCDDQVMIRHFYSPKREVEVDECPACGGFWMDAGELLTIREQFATDEERKAAAHALFRDVFAAEMAQEAARDATARERVTKVVHLFRFICPSYWVPGDQDWGGF